MIVMHMKVLSAIAIAFSAESLWGEYCINAVEGIKYNFRLFPIPFIAIPSFYSYNFCSAFYSLPQVAH